MSVGELELTKKRVSGKEMVIWEGCSRCRGEACCIYDRCGGSKDFCKVEQNYIDHFLATIRKSLGKKATELTLYRIGMHLVPLYKQLCRLKIEEMGIRDVVYESESGSRHVHPIYREMRQVIFLIDKIWKEMGIDIKDLFEIPGEEFGKDIFGGDDEKGDPTYYERVRRRK